MILTRVDLQYHQVRWRTTVRHSCTMHLSVAVMSSNNALIPDLRPRRMDWPLMRLGQRVCGWGDQQTTYYMIGTPIIWWGVTASFFLGLLALGAYVFRTQRRYVDMEAKCVDVSYSVRAISDHAIQLHVQNNGKTFYMLARSHSFGGPCTFVCISRPCLTAQRSWRANKSPSS